MSLSLGEDFEGRIGRGRIKRIKDRKGVLNVVNKKPAVALKSVFQLKSLVGNIFDKFDKTSIHLSDRVLGHKKGDV